VPYRNPIPTVDLVIETRTAAGKEGIVLIERGRPPFGRALPGGFVEYGETLEEAAVREAREETGLKVRLVAQLHTYSDPRRDPRKHTISTVFVAKARGIPVAGDDAKGVGIYALKGIPRPLAFDHERIIGDYVAWKKRRRKRT
jgi:ADP-ribose pyrophosphatase YjhB (NUDIX family)